MPRPKAPNWKTRGDIPDVDPQSARDDQLDLFDEDMLQMVDPTGIYTVDVGWYPAATRDGRFVCRVVRSDDWDRPLDQMETSNIKLIWKWLRREIGEINMRIGQAGGFTTRIGLFVYQTAARKAGSKRRAATRGPTVVPTYLRPIAHTEQTPTPFFAGEGNLQTTTNPSTSAAMAVGLGAGLPLAHAA